MAKKYRFRRCDMVGCPQYKNEICWCEREQRRRKHRLLERAENENITIIVETQTTYVKKSVRIEL